MSSFNRSETSAHSYRIRAAELREQVQVLEEAANRLDEMWANEQAYNAE